MNALSVFAKRRLMRALAAVLGLLLFWLIQAWQTQEASTKKVDALPPTTSSTAVIPTVRSAEGIVFQTTTTNALQAEVLRAVDGDTLEVKLIATGKEIKVRLLGMNTPESVDPRRPVQCFGKEASKRMKELVEGKMVLLVEDLKADDRDKYGRWLRNVVRMEDRLDVNATLVDQGYANAYLSFPLDAKRKAQLRKLEQEAKAAERGLWSPSTCEGKK
ncbi:thermonuclease family protein [Patescibacteria group bacterium]|nr:thermonuclease family protein [Patescibacteria group bacterium]